MKRSDWSAARNSPLRPIIFLAANINIRTSNTSLVPRYKSDIRLIHLKMMRAAILRSARCACSLSITSQAPLCRALLPSPSIVTRTLPNRQPWVTRWYSAPAGLGQEEVEGRILDLLKNFDKVSAFITLLDRDTKTTVYRSQTPRK